MEIISTNIEGLALIKLTTFSDERGYFIERYNKKKFYDFGISDDFLQDNFSSSVKNAIRGLHAQKGQGKLVGVTKGAAFDVAIDIRKNSKTYGKSFSCALNDSNNLLLWIPDGFLHGFQALSQDCHLTYKVTSLYSPDDQFSVDPFDIDLNINWPNKEEAIMNDRDKFSPSFKNLQV